MAAAIIDTNVAIPLRDGCVLSADVYRPDDTARHPTIVNVTYVDKQSRNGMALLINPVVAVERGYAVVIADARGTYRSEGEWRPFHGHADDGYDVVEWAAAQAWSNGRVGMYGSSGHGVTALQAALAAPPHLKAVMLTFTGANYHDGWAFRSGVLELAFSYLWAARITGPSLVSRWPAADSRTARQRAELAGLATDGWRLVRHLPLTDDSLLPRDVVPWLYEWLDHPAYDDYWAGVDAVAQADRITVPVLQVSGWFDLFMPGQLALSQALAASPVPLVAQESRIVIGPWAHDAYIGSRTTAAGDREFGPDVDAGPAMGTRLGLDWFDRWLDGQDFGSAVPDRGVRYYSIGARCWRQAASWPPPAHPLTLYLHSNGHANSRFGDGVLSEQPPGSEPPDSYRYDPRDPTPSTGGPALYLLEPGIKDQARTEERDDILVYTSALLQRPVDIAGAAVLDAVVSTSAADTDFTAKLVDVEPDGYCANVAEGICRLSVAGWHNRAGEPVRISVGLNDVAHRFGVGHRIRLEVASANFPRFARNLNTGVHPHRATAREAVVAQQAVMHAADNLSTLVLPVVDAPSG